MSRHPGKFFHTDTADDTSPAVSFLAVLGKLFLAAFNPQVRAGRGQFARGLALWGACGVAGWLSLDPVADATWISDEAIVVIARVYSWATALWSIGLFVLLARRCHDWALGGGWAFLLCVPGLNVLLIAAALFVPGRPTARQLWRDNPAE
ncbi:DUF805 domain-containing protein [Sutterella sp.]|uniref:DUF805 domain-containing protein n=1 Tax=Sutterella sp. TaxID=1981025 RepID=UPI0026DF4F4A|nr:DUF805 domain-containing protein [Sutterella sp.]MDO5532055.1 DUF805 domain-containing protein [Sutterella sp.]